MIDSRWAAQTTFKNKNHFRIDYLDLYLHGNLLIIPFGSMNQKL